MIDKNDALYIELLKSIGQLEYTSTIKCIKAYQDVISLQPKNYDFYTKINQGLLRVQNYEAKEQLFDVMKVKYEKGLLSEKY